MGTIDYKEIGERIIEAVGVENIESMTHCATRLRLEVRDRDAIDDSQVELIDQVKGVFFNAGQYQIILGTGIVNKVYEQITAQYQFTERNKDDISRQSASGLQVAIRNIADIFVPIIPILGATGLFLGLKGVVLNEQVLGLFNATAADIPQWFTAILTVLTDTAFGFLTAFICWSAFKKIGGLPIIGFLIGLMLVSPALPNAYAVANGTAEPILAFGIIPLVGYQGSILTALITGILGAMLEKKLRKVMPNSMDLIFTPFVVILLSVFLALFILGPIVHGFESQAIKAIEWFLHLPFGIGGLIIGFLYPIAVMTGMHHMFIAIETSLIASTGFNPLITVCAMYGFSNAAVCLAIALRSKSQAFKTAGISATATQILGVSEPALFGVVMRTGMRAIGVMVVSSALGGMVLSLLGIQANSYGLAVLLSPLMYIYSPYQLSVYIIVGLGTFILAFILTQLFVLKKATTSTKTISQADKKTVSTYQVLPPVEGEIVPLEEVNDPVFSNKLIGEGFGIYPESNLIKAPISGEIVMVAPTKHAFGIRDESGFELLVHMGIETVELNGSPFELKINVGDKVEQGVEIGTMDRKEIINQHKDPTVIVIATSAQQPITTIEYSIPLLTFS